MGGRRDKVWQGSDLFISCDKSSIQRVVSVMVPHHGLEYLLPQARVSGAPARVRISAGCVVASRGLQQARDIN